MIVLLQGTFRVWGANISVFSECFFWKEELGSNFTALVLLLCRVGFVLLFCFDFFFF